MKANLAKVLGGVLIAAVMVGNAQADRLAEIKSKGSLTCGVLSTYEPFGYQDPSTRQLVGYDVDFCTAVAKALGVKAVLKPISLEARIPEVNQDRVDLLAALLGYSPARAEQISFSHTYFVSRQKLAVKNGSGYAARDDLSNKRVSAVKGASTLIFLQKEMPTAKQYSFDDAPGAVMAMMQGKVDAFAGSETVIRRFNAKLGEAKQMQILAPELGHESWGIGMKKGEPELLAAVNDALTAMEAKGEAQAIYDKWFGPSTQFQMPREFQVQPITQ